MPTPLFKPSDKVRHAARPEWGPGVVEAVTPVQHEGAAAQKLIIRFEHHGRTTVHTGYARIVPADHFAPAAPPRPAAAEGSTESWLRDLEATPPTQGLVELPLPCTDPIASLKSRLTATLDLFRFEPNARSITDWAIAQTGLTDPLQQFSREQIHDSYGHFCHNRDAHLRDLVRKITRAGETALLDAAAQHRLPAARAALQRARAAR